MLEDGLSDFVLVLRWNGGADTQLVTLTHDGDLVRDALVSRSKGMMTVRYQAVRAAPSRVRALFSFIGDKRSDLVLLCLVDGVQQKQEARAPFAEHRWSVSVDC